MGDAGKVEYMKLCIRYRLLSVFCSTVAYLIWLPGGNHLWFAGTGVAVGMLTACAVGTFLYRRTFFGEENTIWLSITLVLELGAYGVFICLSGGLSSPYLWYFAGCLFLMAAAERYRVLLAVAAVWCVLCIAAGGGQYVDRGFGQSDMNTVIGILIVAGGFYTLQQYTRRLEEQRKNLAAEKKATEQALCQITDLYDMVNIFAMTDQRRSMDEMARLLTRSIANGGCLLLKLKMEERQKIDMVSSDGLDEDTVQGIMEELEKPGTDRKLPQIFTVRGRHFMARSIGKGIFILGILVTVSKEQNKELDSFYVSAVETVFRDMDIHRSLEKGIIRYEQQRIASEIHDTVLQKLFGIACSLKVLEKTAGPLTEQIQSIETSVRLTMQELREAIYGTRFETDESGSFTDRLRLYLEEAEKLNSVVIRLRDEGDFSCLSTGQKTVIYRIVCEAVNNAVRHGKAGYVEVKVTVGEADISVEIRDNGSGFEPSALPADGNGIQNMYYMTSLMKGRFSVHSDIGKGTTVDVLLPRRCMK